MKIIAAIFLCGALALDAHAAVRLPPDADALARAMRGTPVVLLGEVHDNGVQHAGCG